MSQILKKNIQLHASPESLGNSAGERNKMESKLLVWMFWYLQLYAGLVAEKLEWGNSDQITQIIDKYSGGFDLILGADIYILILCSSFCSRKTFIRLNGEIPSHKVAFLSFIFSFVLKIFIRLRISMQI